MQTFNLSAVQVIAQREWVRFLRQRGRLIASLATPIFFWLLMGLGLDFAFPTAQIPTTNGFREYFFPGILILSCLFTSIFSSISIIEDRHEGLLQSVLVSPVSRLSVVLGKCLGTTGLCLFQVVLILFLAPLAGLPLDGAKILGCLGVLALLSLGLSALGFFFAWWLDSSQSFHSIMNLVLFPMWLLSGAFFPLERMPKLLYWLLSLNPVAQGLAALKAIIYEGTPGWNLGWLVISVALLLGLAVSVVQRSR